MTDATAVERLLRWRLALAEADAPPAPPAARLVEQLGPPPGSWADQLRARVERLRRMPLALGYAMVDRVHERTGHPIPVLIARAEDVETSARVLYLAVRDGRLRMRIRLDASPGHVEPAFESTFVADAPDPPPFAGRAELVAGGEYRIEVELPAAVAEAWDALKVTDRMPFRLILRPAPGRA